MPVDKDQWIIGGAVIAVVAVFGMAVWTPQEVRMASLRNEIQASQTMIAAEASAAAELTRTVKAAAELREAMGTSQRFVPRDPKLAELIRDISHELERFGVQDQDIQTSAIVAGADFSTIPVTLRFRTSFSQAFGVMRAIESMRRLVRVVRFEAIGKPEHYDEPVTVTIDLCGFFAVSEAKK